MYWEEEMFHSKSMTEICNLFSFSPGRAILSIVVNSSTHSQTKACVEQRGHRADPAGPCQGPANQLQVMHAPECFHLLPCSSLLLLLSCVADEDEFIWLLLRKSQRIMLTDKLKQAQVSEAIICHYKTLRQLT